MPGPHRGSEGARPCTVLLRALCKGKPGNPASIEKYLAGKFGDHLEEARAAMGRSRAAR